MSAEDRLNELAALHAASTQGTWIAHDIGEGHYSPYTQDTIVDWWVWREEALPNWGGIIQLDQSASTGDPPGSPVGEIHSGEMEARKNGTFAEPQSEADAKFIAAAHEYFPKLVNTLGAILTLHKRVEYPDPDHSTANKNICVECEDSWPCWTYKVATTAWEK